MPDETVKQPSPGTSACTHPSSCGGRRGLALLVVTLWAAAALSGCGKTTVNMGNAPTESATTTLISPFDATTDFSDIRNLMAKTTHVFTGRVDDFAGSKSRSSFPETQFTVTTGVQLKGEVSATVIVNQQGGTRSGAYMSLGGDRPLNIGQWYLFATKGSPSEGWFTLIPIYGDVRITEQQARDPSSPPLAAASAAHNDNLQGAPRSSAAPTETPSLTFPIPQPGDKNPPPYSPPQPTS